MPLRWGCYPTAEYCHFDDADSSIHEQGSVSISYCLLLFLGVACCGFLYRSSLPLLLSSFQGTLFSEVDCEQNWHFNISFLSLFLYRKAIRFWALILKSVFTIWVYYFKELFGKILRILIIASRHLQTMRGWLLPFQSGCLWSLPHI